MSRLEIVRVFALIAASTYSCIVILIDILFKHESWFPLSIFHAQFILSKRFINSRIKLCFPAVLIAVTEILYSNCLRNSLQ